MKLSNEQLDEIKAFISKKGFTYIDLQLEILDHVACKVEEKLSQDPKKSFEKALKETHAEFGVFGFQTLEEAFIKGLTKKYARIRLDAFYNWLKFPNIIILALATILVYLIFTTFSDTTAHIILFTVTFIPITYFFIQLWPSSKRYAKTLTMRSSGMIIFPFLGFQIYNLLYNLLPNPWNPGYEWMVVFYVFFVLFCLFEVQTRYLAHQYALKRCKELEEVYGKLIVS